MNAAKGNFDGPHQDYQIDSNDQLVTSTDYKKVVVAFRDGAPVMLTDVANIVDGVENTTQAAWMNSDAGDHCERAAPAGRQHHQRGQEHQAAAAAAGGEPAEGVKVTTLTDLTTPIQASVNDVEFELLLTVALVVMVIFLFLRSLYATIIPSVAVPLSLVGTFGGDVCAGLQPGQPVADGADDLDRVRGGRRDRDGGEHLALPGRGRARRCRRR